MNCLKCNDTGDTGQGYLDCVHCEVASEKAGRQGARELSPPNSLPTWSECSMRIANSDFIAERVAEGGYGAEPGSLLASALHRFIYEYDDADPYRSAWFMHHLELVLKEAAQAAPAVPEGAYISKYSHPRKSVTVSFHTSEQAAAFQDVFFRQRKTLHATKEKN